MRLLYKYVGSPRRFLVVAVSSLVQSTRGVSSWPSLRSAAASPVPRLFDAHERLFGADKPTVVFWRDSAGWCPFC
eukprot:3287612-Prymnesium_polylepis.1